MNTTIEVRRMVEVIACSTSGQVRRRCNAASTMAPTAPMAPASVGVARPRPMVPRTRKISTMEGIMPHNTRLTSFHPIGSRACSGIGGIECGRMIAMMTMNSRKIATCRIDGPMAPRYMSPTERPSWSARMISTSDGGISCVMVPDAAMTPVASFMS